MKMSSLETLLIASRIETDFRKFVSRALLEWKRADAASFLDLNYRFTDELGLGRYSGVSVQRVGYNVMLCTFVSLSSFEEKEVLAAIRDDAPPTSERTRHRQVDLNLRTRAFTTALTPELDHEIDTLKLRVKMFLSYLDQISEQYLPTHMFQPVPLAHKIRDEWRNNPEIQQIFKELWEVKVPLPVRHQYDIQVLREVAAIRGDRDPADVIIADRTTMATAYRA